MKTIKKVKVTPEFVDTIPEKLVQDVIYITKRYGTAVHLCLCGCGNESVTPIGKNDWSLMGNDDFVTFRPSILNNNCPNKCHYVITDNIANII